MEQQPNKKVHLPNIAGYKFIAVFEDGSTKEDEVFIRMERSQFGTFYPVHTTNYFSQMIGWRRLQKNN